uniref:Putative ribonuclease H-like domain-containing protein n=1 Tax=Tanacetum cinerariifolium TaxID=118510 RepID=A0A6L2LJZ4_TANCI|nr:putative ribonuclease H-like domain-containing protein [Tanacetum cinerariifolium]
MHSLSTESEINKKETKIRNENSGSGVCGSVSPFVSSVSETCKPVLRGGYRSLQNNDRVGDKVVVLDFGNSKVRFDSCELFFGVSHSEGYRHSAYEFPNDSSLSGSYIRRGPMVLDFKNCVIRSVGVENDLPRTDAHKSTPSTGFQVTPKLSHLHAVKRIFRKSTTGGCQFLGRRLISWQCKKRTIVATSTTEAEYVAAANCCGQKTENNAEFHQIVDFLTSSSIHHSLTRALVFLKPGDLIFLIQVWMLTLSIRRRGDSLVLAATTASLDAHQDSSNITKTQSKATLNEPTPQGEGSGSGLGRQETIRGAMAQIRSEGALIQSIDPPLPTGYTVGSEEDRMEHDIELMDPVPQTPYDSPLSGGHIPGSDEGIMTLKELTDLCTTLLQKVLDLKNVKTAQAKEIDNLKKRVTKLEHRQSLRILDEDADIEMIVKDKGNGEKGGCIAETVSTARPDISAARPEVSTAKPKTPPTTTTLFDDDVAIDDTLIKVKNQKAKEKGIAFKDVDDSARPIRSITTLQPLPTIDPKDNGKGILQEPKPVKKTKKKDQDQIERDAEVALKIQAHLDKKARIEKERQEEAFKAALAEMYDEVQAQIDADHELAVRLTHEEQDKYTVEEMFKLLAEFFKRRKKHLAKERADAIKSKPPTKTQLRKLMMTYLKHAGRFTHTQLKSRSFEEIQKLYIKEQKWVDAFVPIGSEKDEKRIRSRKKRVACSSSKHKSPKKQKVNDQEYEDTDKEHRKCLKVVPNDDKAIDYETLDVKSPIAESNDPKGYDLILWGDLKTLVESSEDDEIWRGKKRYPLTKEILEKMLSSRLEAETEKEKGMLEISYLCLKLVIYSTQKSVMKWSSQLKTVLNDPVFKADLLAALHKHLQSTQPVLEKLPQRKKLEKKETRRRRRRRRRRRKKKMPKASTGSQTMEE